MREQQGNRREKSKWQSDQEQSSQDQGKEVRRAASGKGRTAARARSARAKAGDVTSTAAPASLRRGYR